VATAAGGEQLPQFPNADAIAYRLKFLKEELDELHQAISERQLADAADALVDIVWVALGTAHYFGLPFDQLWAEVRRANMDKIRLPRGDDPTQKNWRVDVIAKPKGWKPPNLDPIIQQAAEFGVRGG
jgi:predicted HAD superfamily Cof-like phosphohydrolase